jgi:hypothetical protein
MVWRALLFSFASLGLTACVLPPTAAQRLGEAAYDFNTEARFGRMDIAGEHVREIARDEFARKHVSWGKSVRVVDSEISGMSIRKDGDADVTVTVTWQRESETTMRTTDVTQRWTSTHGTWTILSEEEHSGDRGLIGDTEQAKVDDAAPPAPGKSRYQTRTIYEQ